MGIASARCLLLGSTAAFLATSSAEKPLDAATSSQDRPCPPSTNSTQAFLRCLAWRHEHGYLDLDEATLSPTEALEQEAIKYFQEVSKNREGIGSFSKSRKNIFTAKLQEQLYLWNTRRDLPRIYILGKWDTACEMLRETLGYRYSMEHWLFGMISTNAALLVEDVKAADFVLLPHCATGVFMHMVVKDLNEGKAEDKSSPSRPPRLRSYPSNQSAELRRRAGESYLSYEGNLPATSVVSLDNTYFMNKARTQWLGVSEFEECRKRPNCKFLIANIYGRHVWRTFSALLGDKALWVTHAGMSDWLRQHPEVYSVPHAGASSAARPAPDNNQCRASCQMHCMMDPPPVLKQDIVLPWVIAFEWTSRASRFHQRDILAFYSGTENSCSRKVVRESFAGRLEQEMSFSAEAKRLTDRVLIFPATFRLRQEDWSELAYRSKLCICPDGDSPNTGRLIEVIMHGCVPLIISNRLQPPFHEYIDWTRVAFFMREDSIPDLPRILEERFAGQRGARELAEKQELLQQLSFVSDYSRDGVSSTLTLALRERAMKLRELDDA